MESNDTSTLILRHFPGVCVLYAPLSTFIDSCYAFSLQLAGTFWVDQLSVSQMLHLAMNLLTSDRTRQQSYVLDASRNHVHLLRALWTVLMFSVAFHQISSDVSPKPLICA